MVGTASRRIPLFEYAGPSMSAMSQIAGRFGTASVAVVAHHRFSIEFACPACGASGAISVAEDAGPPFTDTPRRTYTTDQERFALIAGGDPPGVKCRACRAIFLAPL